MNFLNLHILQTLPLSNLNRDDADSPKSLIYGGVHRARISSQALKRAARVAFETSRPADSTSRSKFAAEHLVDLVLECLAAQGVTPDTAVLAKVAHHARHQTQRLTTGDMKRAAAIGADTLVWLAESEVRDLARRIADLVTDDATPETSLDGWVQSRTASLTIAGFGRMFANTPNLQTEAAVQVAHAFTTHAAVTEIDYFSAVDDARGRYSDDAGVGHLGFNEFTSGVFYRYLNVDRNQLRTSWSDLEADDASPRLMEFYKALLLELPSGRAAATAPRTLPSVIIAQLSTMPLSYADTFESPVDELGGGFTAPSRARLLDFAARVRAHAPALLGDALVMDLATLDANPVTTTDLAAFATRWTLESPRNGE